MTKIIFVQPFTVNANLAAQCEGKTVVLDVAFNTGSPQGKGTPVEQFNATTIEFLSALGEQLVLYLDHHDHVAWKDFAQDPRFVLIPREHAAACPPLITPELCALYGEADTIICHGDIDGIYAAAKYVLGGYEPYNGADNDSIAIDSRVGVPSAQGAYYDEALKADLRNDAIRTALYTVLTSSLPNTVTHYGNAVGTLVIAHETYEALKTETEQLSSLFAIYGTHLCFVDARGAQPFDLTQLLLTGQRLKEVSAVLHTQNGFAQWTIAAPRSWDLREKFHLDGGSPNRVNLSSNFTVKEIAEALKGEN